MSSKLPGLSGFDGDKPAPTFSFGSKMEEESKPAPAFSFGSKMEEESKPAPAFSFGAKKEDGDKPTTTPTFSFNFGNNTNNTGFSFATNAQPAFNLSPKPEEKQETKEEEEDEGMGGQEGVQVLHRVRAKVHQFDKEKNNWVSLGTGTFRIEEFEDDHSRRVIFVIDSGAVKINCNFSKKMPVTVTGNKIRLPLCVGEGFASCLITVKMASDAELLKSKLEEYFE